MHIGKVILNLYLHYFSIFTIKILNF